MHGGSADDFVGRPGAHVLSPAWQDKVADLVAEAGARGSPPSDHRARAPGRQRVSRRDRGDHHRRPRRAGRCTGCRGRRISARGRRPRPPHRETGAMFEAAFAAAPNGVAMIGLDGRFLRVNDALCAMLGRAEAELVGHPTIEVCHPGMTSGDAGRVRRPCNAASAAGVHREALTCDADGEVVWAYCRGIVVRDASDEPSYIVTHFVDFTARKLAAEPRAAGRPALRACLRRRADRHGARRRRRPS